MTPVNLYIDDSHRFIMENAIILFTIFQLKLKFMFTNYPNVISEDYKEIGIWLITALVVAFGFRYIRYNQVNQLYQLNDYHLVWINCDHQKKILLELLYFSNDKGLNEKEYQFEFIRDYRSGAIQFRNQDDSVNTDILLTDAALHFFS